MNHQYVTHTLVSADDLTKFTTSLAILFFVGSILFIVGIIIKSRIDNRDPTLAIHSQVRPKNRRVRI